MRKLSVAFAAAAAILLVSSLAWNADAQTSRGAAKYARAITKLHTDRKSRLWAVLWCPVRTIPSLGLRSPWPLLVRSLLIATRSL